MGDHHLAKSARTRRRSGVYGENYSGTGDVCHPRKVREVSQWLLLSLFLGPAGEYPAYLRGKIFGDAFSREPATGPCLECGIAVGRIRFRSDHDEHASGDGFRGRLPEGDLVDDDDLGSGLTIQVSGPVSVLPALVDHTTV